MEEIHHGSSGNPPESFEDSGSPNEDAEAEAEAEATDSEPEA
jgi:hypothetical protein